MAATPFLDQDVDETSFGEKETRRLLCRSTSRSGRQDRHHEARQCKVEAGGQAGKGMGARPYVDEAGCNPPTPAPHAVVDECGFLCVCVDGTYVTFADYPGQHFPRCNGVCGPTDGRGCVVHNADGSANEDRRN
nr:unnamed protein product [Digitaria exilis]